jgi:glycosyltransferase involved in cell wall biosynthesis
MCITYGRTSVLDECVHSFLIQDYPGEKELVILNDYPHLELVYDSPNVKVINDKKRHSSLGAKRNACIERCEGEIICVWDDDDIHLPHRISMNINKMSGHYYVMPNCHIYYSTNGMGLVDFPLRGQAFFYKDLWKDVGGYPRIEVGEDWGFENKIRDANCFYQYTINPTRVDYIYRWGITGSYHSSYYPDDLKGRSDKYLKENVNVRLYKIKPSWKKMYHKLALEAINSEK